MISKKTKPQWVITEIITIDNLKDNEKGCIYYPGLILTERKSIIKNENQFIVINSFDEVVCIGYMRYNHIQTTKSVVDLTKHLFNCKKIQIYNPDNSWETIYEEN